MTSRTRGGTWRRAATASRWNERNRSGASVEWLGREDDLGAAASSSARPPRPPRSCRSRRRRRRGSGAGASPASTASGSTTFGRRARPAVPRAAAAGCRRGAGRAGGDDDGVGALLARDARRRRASRAAARRRGGSSSPHSQSQMFPISSRCGARRWIRTEPPGASAASSRSRRRARAARPSARPRARPGRRPRPARAAAARPPQRLAAVLVAGERVDRAAGLADRGADREPPPTQPSLQPMHGRTSASPPREALRHELGVGEQRAHHRDEVGGAVGEDPLGLGELRTRP